VNDPIAPPGTPDEPTPLRPTVGENGRRWWQDAVVYQAYVRSFRDSTGNGIGDLEGLRSSLDHIASLGVDALWLNPCYPSPQRDHGYDVADYFDIEPDYGTLDAFDRLLADAHGHGIRILMDIVPNHCSSDHPWFRAALAAAPGSDERARFWFRDGRGVDGSEPPNNWMSGFGGSAWTRVGDRPDADPDDRQWYLGTFTPHQPDFDHTNADVQQLFADALVFWFDRGVDGFRVDAVSPVGKHPDLPDQPPVPPDTHELAITWENPYTVFRPEGHDVWRRWRAVIDRYTERHPERDPMMVAEAYAVRQPDVIREFTRPDEFHQAFTFDLMMSPWDTASIEWALREPLELFADTGAPPAWVLNNHDIQRIVTRLGRRSAADPASWTNNPQRLPDEPVDLAVGTRRARALVAFVTALPGSLYLYQGEELGLPEVLDLPDEARQDPIFLSTGGTQVGRDGCRIPLPWTADPATSFGFSPGPEPAAPWLPQPAWWGGSAAGVDSGNPMLELYRRLGVARREHATPQPLDAELSPAGDGLVAVRRGSLVAVLNVTDRAVDLEPSTDVSMANLRRVFASETVAADTDASTIPPCSTVWLRD